MLRDCLTLSLEEPGIELAAFWLPVNPLFLLSYCRHQEFEMKVLNSGRITQGDGVGHEHPFTTSSYTLDGIGSL